MTTHCAWCAHPEPARPAGAPAVSHGICRSCLDTRLAALPPRRAPRRGTPSLPLRWLAAPTPAPAGA